MIRTFTLRYPEELRDQLRKIAEKRGFTVNGLILQILREWASKQSDRPA